MPFLDAWRDLLAIPLALAFIGLGGALHVASGWRRAAAFATAPLIIVAPWIASTEAPGVRFVCAGGTALALFRNLDLARDRPAYDALRRAIHVMSVVDSRRVTRTAPGLEWVAWRRVVGFGVPTAVTTWLLIGLGPPADLGRVAWWLLGAVWAYTSIEALTATARAVARLLGFSLPTLHRDPILARSLSEFWGQRWNLCVRSMLHDHCFWPLARRAGVAAAVLGSFAASAALHFWLILPAGGLAMASSMGAYFLLQGLLVLLERRIGVARSCRPLQHAWTVSGVVLPLPLFLEPLLTLAFR